MRQRDSRSMSPRRESLNTSGSRDTTRADSRHMRENRDRSIESPKNGDMDAKPKDEIVSDDDLCPVCHLLLYNPVTTRCNHTLCATCMAHWADVSMTSQMTVLAPSSSPSMFSGADTEARCPMCRTPTNATQTSDLAAQLQQKYPIAYPARAAEETTEDDPNNGTIETLTLCIGNSHKLISPGPDSHNMHEWTFFVRPSRRDIISGVEIQLHPTFRPPTIYCKSAPYEIRRKGWGYFTITVSVDLKKGWSWVSEDAEEVPFRGDDAKARLLLDWTLDFAGHEGKGSMGRCRLKVRKEGDGERREREEEDRVNDGRWEVEMVNDDEGEEEENGDGEEGEEEEEEEEMFEGTSDVSDE
ncbi:hypothetical protein D6D29_08544 [Aureobasidium pullulans]|uniref:Uncharacterized protein n=1 Tax=Aureobasidium pullulans TaxID=5580 RepID=A0A4S8SYU1_AURPU|nr:hypothetical protein D6D29_08544 [Aureobasidium pullulans]THX25394.1 hypothetical protein D6D10_09922 [Aureobasidium pullulans]